jgi:outer membrane protein assembly factor BamA
LGNTTIQKTIFTNPNSSGEDSSQQSKLNNIGYILSNDTRNDVNYPGHGIFFNYKINFTATGLAATTISPGTFSATTSFSIWQKNEKHILAVRGNGDLTTGDVPFEGQSVVGMDDIRGYSQGKYRNNQVYSLQAEYRWNFYKRFGMVGFFGCASAVESFGNIFNSEVLPGAGAGVRWRMIPSEKST